MKYHTWLQHTLIAHRGLWNDCVPENSLMAFRRAMEKGMPIELDVQMLHDGTIVVFHDWSLQRMCAKDNMASDMTKEELLSCSLVSSTAYIPLLQEVLHLVQGRVPIIIEMKNKRHAREVFLGKVSAILNAYDGAYVLSSFDPFLIKKAKKFFPHALCGQNFSDYRQYGAMMGYVRKVGMYAAWIMSMHMPDFFVFHATMVPKCWLVHFAKRKNKPILVWGKIPGKQRDHIMRIVDNLIVDP